MRRSKTIPLNFDPKALLNVAQKSHFDGVILPGKIHPRSLPWFVI
jgi:hypothetical protein